MKMTDAEIEAGSRPADALFPARKDAQRTATCVFDPRHDATDFRDVLSEREYRISGICQDCQDRTYGA